MIYDDCSALVSNALRRYRHIAFNNFNFNHLEFGSEGYFSTYNTEVFWDTLCVIVAPVTKSWISSQCWSNLRHTNMLAILHLLYCIYFRFPCYIGSCCKYNSVCLFGDCLKTLLRLKIKLFTKTFLSDN